MLGSPPNLRHELRPSPRTCVCLPPLAELRLLASCTHLGSFVSCFFIRSFFHSGFRPRRSWPVTRCALAVGRARHSPAGSPKPPPTVHCGQQVPSQDPTCHCRRCLHLYHLQVGGPRSSATPHPAHPSSPSSAAEKKAAAQHSYTGAQFGTIAAGRKKSRQVNDKVRWRVLADRPRPELTIGPARFAVARSNLQSRWYLRHSGRELLHDRVQP